MEQFGVPIVLLLSKSKEAAEMLHISVGTYESSGVTYKRFCIHLLHKGGEKHG